MKVFKDANVKFQAERVGDVYMVRNLEVIVGGLQLFSASRAEIMKQLGSTMVSRRMLSCTLKGDWE